MIARCNHRILGLVASLLATVGCGSTVEQTGLTGVDLTVRFDAALSLEELAIAGAIDGEAAFAPGILPETPRPLDPTGETLLILVDPAFDASTVIVRVDGMAGGQVLATGAAPVTVVGEQLVRATLMLGPPPECGDGEVVTDVEPCDDGNVMPGDGCSPQCRVETGWQCSNQPQLASECSRLPACSDGVDNDLDGFVDFVGGDDGCSSGADQSEEGACTAACAASSQCSETCQHDECAWSCNTAGCGCDLDCNAAATSCELDCTGNDCDLQCDGVGACSAACRSSSTCEIDCQDAATCDVACTMSSTCEINCDGAGSCAAICTNGSKCLLNCGNSPDCSFTMCQGGGGAQSCPGNIIVCNQPCP